MESLLPYTGKEFLESLNDGREVWIYGERVNHITEHPGFRNTARMIARLYDALHRDHAEKKDLLTCPTEWGGFTHRYFVAPRSAEELTAGRDAIAAWARITYGWLGRSPDYKGAFLGTLEPIHKVVESEESVVIPSLAPASLLRGAECGSLNTAVRPTAMACATRMI